MTRSLLKIVKSSQVVHTAQTVDIDNTVILPPPPPEPELSQEEESAATLEEKRRREEERRIQERIRTEVEAQVASQQAGIQHSKEEILIAAHNAKFEMLAEASAESDRILEKARAEAADMVGQAQAEAEELRRQAQEEGRAEGLALGKKDAANQTAKYLQAAAQLVSGIQAKKEAYFISVEEELRETVLELVKKITLAELRASQDTILGILKQAARSFRNSDYLKITLSPLNVTQEIAGDLDFIRTVVGNIPEIEVELPADVPDGTVRVDNGHEIIDASVPTQLEFLREILQNSRDETAKEPETQAH